MRFLSPAFLFLSCFVFPASSAHGSIKQYIIKDCPRALEELKVMSEQERSEVLPYLVLVLKLAPARAGEGPPELPQLPGALAPYHSPYSEAMREALWRSFEPERVEEARRCALEITSALYPISVGLLPDLVHIAAGITTEAQDAPFRSALERTIFHLTAEVKRGQHPLTHDSVQGLTEALRGGSRGLAERVLIELGEGAILSLFDVLEGEGHPESRDAIIEILLTLDPDGDQIDERFTRLLDSRDEGLRTRAVSALAKLRGINVERVLPVTVRLLSDESVEVQESAFSLLFWIVHLPAFETVAADPETVTGLIQSLERPDAGQRGIVTDALSRLFTPTPNLLEKLFHYATQQADGDLRGRAIYLLALRASESVQVFPLVRRALYDIVPNVRVVALAALSAFSNHRQDAIQEILRALKRAEEGDVEHKTRAAVAAAHALVGIGAAKAAAPAVSYLMDALSYDGLGSLMQEVLPPQLSHLGFEDVVQAILGMEGTVSPALARGLRSEKPIVRQRILHIIGRTKLVDEKLLKSLVDELGSADHGVRHEARLALLYLGERARPPLYRSLEHGDAARRLEVVRVLLGIDPGDDAALKHLSGAVGEYGCEDKLQLARLRIEGFEEVRNALSAGLVQCLTTIDAAEREDAVRLLTDHAPLPPKLIDEVVQLIVTPTIDPALQRILLERVDRLGASPSQISRVATDLLVHGKGPIRFKSLTALARLGTEGRDALPTLLKLREELPPEDLFAYEVTSTIAAIDPDALDYVAFFIGEIHDGRTDMVQKAIRRMLPSVAVPILDRLLAEGDLEHRDLILRLIGEFGREASRIAHRIVPFLDDPSRSTQYEATVALLKIAPLHPRVEQAVERAVEAGERRELSEEQLGDEARAVLEKVSAPAGQR